MSNNPDKTMAVKAPNPATTIPHPGDTLPDRLVRLAIETAHLKHLFRQGWLQRAVPEPRCETVAEHIFSVTLLALLLVDHLRPDLDRTRVLELALIHDLGEIHAGDITPAHQVASSEKARLERDALHRLLDPLPQGQRYLDLWEELERQSTPEARFVREVDRLEMAVQALIYEQQLDTPVDDFFQSAAAAVQSPTLQPLLARLQALRRRGHAAGGSP